MGRGRGTGWGLGTAETHASHYSPFPANIGDNGQLLRSGDCYTLQKWSNAAFLST